MLKHRVIPLLLIKNNGLVKTTNFKNPVYIGDPINAVKIFNDKEVDELLLLDITATNEKKEIEFEKIQYIVSEAFMPIGYGGGINSIKQMERLFRIGIEKIVLNSHIYSEIELIKKAKDIFGSQSIVVSIDVKKNIFGKYTLHSHSGEKKQRKKLETHIIEIQDLGCGEIILTNIEREGTMQGYDLNLIKNISSITKVPLIVNGGAGKIAHFVQAIKNGANAVSAGSMFVFQGIHRAVLISYPEYNELTEALNK